MVAVVVAGADHVAQAQCGSNASSCLGCHEVQRQRPVLEQGAPWHRDHGFGDLCASCHGGVSDENTLAGAHVGLHDPLAAPASTCGSCHSQGLDGFVTAYRNWKRPASAELKSSDSPDGYGGPSGPSPARVRTVDLVLATLALMLAATIALIVRRRRAASHKRLGAWLRTTLWSPYVAGAGLGVVVAVSELVCGRPIAVSGAFDKLAAYPGRALFPDSQYYTHVLSPGITWQVWLVIGLLGGSFLASRLAGEARWRWLPDTQWVARFGPSRARRMIVAFIGGLLVQVGAGIAGGCTSGLAISGGAVLAPAAFLFMAGMFAGGIPAARLLYLGHWGRQL